MICNFDFSLSGHGKFFNDFVNFNESQYKTIRTIGSSTLSKGLAMPLEELEELIKWAKDNKTNAEIVERVEKHVVPSLEWVSDATYDMGSSL